MTVCLDCVALLKDASQFQRERDAAATDRDRLQALLNTEMALVKALRKELAQQRTATAAAQRQARGLRTVAARILKEAGQLEDAGSLRPELDGEAVYLKLPVADLRALLQALRSPR